MANRTDNAERNARFFDEVQHEGQKFERYVMESGCPVNASQELEVAVPATVRARAEIGDVNLCCADSGIISANGCEVTGRPNAVSKFTIKQKLRVDIPVKFEVEAFVGEGHVNFDSADIRDPAPCGCEA